MSSERSKRIQELLNVVDDYQQERITSHPETILHHALRKRGIPLGEEHTDSQGKHWQVVHFPLHPSIQKAEISFHQSSEKKDHIEWDVSLEIQSPDGIIAFIHIKDANLDAALNKAEARAQSVAHTLQQDDEDLTEGNAV